MSAGQQSPLVAGRGILLLHWRCIRKRPVVGHAHRPHELPQSPCPAVNTPQAVTPGAESHVGPLPLLGCGIPASESRDRYVLFSERIDENVTGHL